ncbi:hypothetical protein ACLB1N_12365 [Escherichia coli]
MRRHFAFSLTRSKVTPCLVQRINVAFLVQVTVTRQQSLTAMQAAARQCKALVVSRR